MSDVSLVGEEPRSSDSDTEGSLVDFLVGDDTPVQTLPGEDHEVSIDDFPYDPTILQQHLAVNPEGGPRRSLRQRNPVERYQDPQYVQLMGM